MSDINEHKVTVSSSNTNENSPSQNNSPGKYIKIHYAINFNIIF